MSYRRKRAYFTCWVNAVPFIRMLRERGDDLPTVADALALELARMTEERDHLRSLLFGKPAGPWIPIKPEGAPYWGIRTTTGETVVGTASGLSGGDALLICNLRAFYTGTALYPHPAAVAVDEAAIIAAYKRGANWALENGAICAPYLSKAASDYADKAAALLPATSEGENK